jgi:lysophospholipase L1-like esterase
MVAGSNCTRNRKLVLALLAAVLALAFVVPVGRAVASPLRYVALGDSYSAASGVLPLDLLAPPQCLRSTRNYPHVIAAATGAQLRDVTCGAAETGDFFESQYPGVAPQLDALSPETQLVTMTIGGNDSNVFIETILACGAAGLSTLGQGSPCKDRYGSSFEETIKTSTYPALVRALGAVEERAPQARVAILGYPWIMPATGGCFDKMPVAQGDVPYVRGIQATLNDAVQRAAAATGATYVDFSTVSNGHDACQPIGVRWIEPVLQGTNPVIVHPNALGESEMAAQTMLVLGLN